ncbi:MAG: ABA4-like family protein [Pseudomonadota bacterium]
MDTAQLFQFAGQAAMLGWVILLLLPRHRYVFWLPRYAIPFGLCLLYAALWFGYGFTGDGGFDSLTSVRALFERDEVLLAGWVHYLAFDLFIGSWIAQEADALRISRLLQAPLLVATFLFGPVGLGIFLALRSGYRWRQSEATPS